MYHSNITPTQSWLATSSIPNESVEFPLVSCASFVGSNADPRPRSEAISCFRTRIFGCLTGCKSQTKHHMNPAHTTINHAWCQMSGLALQVRYVKLMTCWATILSLPLSIWAHSFKTTRVKLQVTCQKCEHTHICTRETTFSHCHTHPHTKSSLLDFSTTSLAFVEVLPEQVHGHSSICKCRLQPPTPQTNLICQDHVCDKAV